MEETAQQRYERELKEWEARTYESEMHKAMCKPNAPGYYRANND
jgi:hypothetical protein